MIFEWHEYDSFWSESTKGKKEDNEAFLGYYEFLTSKDEYLSDELTKSLYRAMARVNRFKFRVIQLPIQEDFEVNLFNWFSSNANDDQYMIDSLKNERDWSYGAAYRYLLKLVPPFIRQGTKIPKNIQKYYELAASEYINEHEEACIALCRATLEGILKVKLGKKMDEFVKLGMLIDDLGRTKIIDEKSWKHACEINNQAKKVLHNLKPADSKDSSQALNSLRYFIESFFGYENLKKRKQI